MSEPTAPAPNLPPPPPGWASPSGWGSPPPKRRRRRPLLLSGAVALAIALVAGTTVFALTQGGTSAEARPLALSFTTGQSQSYAIHMTMDGNVSSDLFGEMPMQMAFDEVVSWKVTSVDADGVATIEMSVEDVSGSMDGMQIPSSTADMPPVQIRVAPDGRILSAGGFAFGAEQTQGFGFPGMGQLTPILPDDGAAVAPGDRWDKHFSQDFPFGDGTIEYTATSTYDRNETVNGRDAAVIVTDLSVPMDFTMDFRDLLDAAGDVGAAGVTGIEALADASISYSGSGTVKQTSFVDLAAKELLKSESSGDFDISMQMEGVPGFEGGMAFTGTFTQRVEAR